MSLSLTLARRLPMIQPCRLLSRATASKGFTEVVRPRHDAETHTGQHWVDKDFRMARFVGKHKQVNKNFAIDLVNEAEPIVCTERVISCDGGGGPLGHPKVFINLDKPGNHTCGYCGLRFYRDHAH